MCAVHTLPCISHKWLKVMFLLEYLLKFSCTNYINNVLGFNYGVLLSDFINLTQVHNFTVSAQDIFTFRRLSVLIVSFTGILQLLMQIKKRFVPTY